MYYGIIYHNYCNDGKVAAKVTQLGIQVNQSVDAYPKGECRFFAASYHDDVFEQIKTSFNEQFGESVVNKIFIVDFSLTTEELNELVNIYKCDVVMIDHHVGALDKIERNKLHHNIEIVYKEDRSGCQLAYDYFRDDFDHVEFGDDLYPPMVRDVGYRDIWVDGWQEDYPNAKALHVGLFDAPTDSLNPFGNAQYSYLVEKGSAVLNTYDKMADARKNQNVVRDIAFTDPERESDEVEVAKTLLTFMPFEFFSDFADKMKNNEGYDLVIAATFVGERGFKMSYRSSKESGYARSIAKAYGGNGHAAAAGSYIGFEQLQELYSNPETVLTFEKAIEQ